MSQLTTEAKRALWLSEWLSAFSPGFPVNLGVIERLASLTVGAIVLLLIARRFLIDWGLAIVGGYLVYRGATGYCPLYASEQIDTRGWRPRWRWLERSKNDEQDDSARQMAPHAWWPEN